MMKQIILGAAVVAAVSGCSKGGDPKGVVQDFVSRVGSGSNCTGLKDMILASQRDLMGPALEQGCAAVGKAGATAQTAPTVGDSTVNGDDATVSISDSGVSHSVRLKKENGAWKIDVASLSM